MKNKTRKSIYLLGVFAFLFAFSFASPAYGYVTTGGLIPTSSMTNGPSVQTQVYPNPNVMFESNYRQQYDDYSDDDYYSRQDRYQEQRVASVVTKNAYDMTETSARLNGYVSSTQSATVYYQYGTSNNLGRETNRQNVGGINGDVPMVIDSLIPGTTYYYRVVAENGSGRAVGNIVSFTTRNEVVRQPAATTTRTTTTPPRTEVRGTEEVTQPEQNIEDTSTGLEALSFFGSGNFLPDTVFEWILVFFLILIIIILARQFRAKPAHDAHH